LASTALLTSIARFKIFLFGVRIIRSFGRIRRCSPNAVQVVVTTV
jgi:hypothetical protein